MTFSGFPISTNPKYAPAITVATPEPTNDKFRGVSVSISIKKNAINNRSRIEMEIIYFFITKLEFPVEIQAQPT